MNKISISITFIICFTISCVKYTSINIYTNLQNSNYVCVVNHSILDTNLTTVKPSYNVIAHGIYLSDFNFNTPSKILDWELNSSIEKNVNKKSLNGKANFFIFPKSVVDNISWVLIKQQQHLYRFEVPINMISKDGDGYKIVYP